MKKKLFNVLLAASLITATACGNKNKTADSTEMAKDQNEQKFEDTNMEKDTKWAVEVADAGMMEVQASQLALSKTSTMAVKEFAQKMVDDHSKANDELKAWAMKKNVTLPTTLSEDKQKDYNDLAEKSGMDFDKAYMDMMVDDHQKAVDKFEKVSDDANDADLRTWAAGKLPILKNHLEMAKTTKDMVKDMKKDAKHN